MPSLVGRRVAEILKRRTDVFCAAIYEGFLMKGLGNIWFLTPSPMTCRAFKFTKHWLPPAIFLQTVYCCVSQCFLDVSALAGVLCPPLWSCLFVVSGLVSHLGWDAASASLVLLSPVLSPICFVCVSGLGAVRFVFTLIPISHIAFTGRWRQCWEIGFNVKKN